MKYTLNDIPGSSYDFSIDNKNITLIDIPFAVSKGNIFTIINATRNIIMYRVDIVIDLPVSGNIIDLSNIDLTGMDHHDELIIIMDLPIQKTETNDEEGNIMLGNIQQSNSEINQSGNVIASNTSATIFFLEQIQDLNDTLLELTTRMAILPAVRGVLNDLRVSVLNTVGVTISSGTVTAVTTVGSVTNIAQIGSNNMNALLQAMQNNTVANAITNRIDFN